MTNNRITEFPSDRIMLIVGSEHVEILSDPAPDSPRICMADTQEYLR